MKTILPLFIFFGALFAVGCTKSPGGSVEELVKTLPPTFGGLSQRLFSTPSAAFVLNGECDPISYAVEWSLNNLTWTTIAGGCPNRTFTLDFTVNRQLKVYVRAKTKTGYTTTAIATIRLILPPTSPYLKLVQSGQASDENEAGTQNDLSDVSSQTMNNGIYIIRSTMTDILYDR